MKKTLIALAALAVSGASFAQSSATISGNVSYQYLNSPTSPIAGQPNLGDDSAPNRNAGSAKGFGLALSTLRFRGSEDLGSGLKASFDAEFGFGKSRNDSFVKRDTSVSLAGSMGTLKLANTRTDSYLVTYGQVGKWTNSEYTPYDYSASIVNRVPADVVSYTTPVAYYGLTGVASYYEYASDGRPTPATKAASLAVNYANGPWQAGLRVFSAHNSSWNVDPVTHLAWAPGHGIRKTSAEIGANYNFGWARVGLAFDTGRAGFDRSEDGGVSAGITVPVWSNVTLGLGGIKRGHNHYADFRANYAFSKRTELEFNYGKLRGVKGYYNIVLAHAF